jgi:hypothetical protein
MNVERIIDQLVRHYVDDGWMNDYNILVEELGEKDLKKRIKKAEKEKAERKKQSLQRTKDMMKELTK